MSRKSRISIIVGVIVILCGLGVWWMLSHGILLPKQDAGNNGHSISTNIMTDSMIATDNKAIQVATNQGPKAGQAVLDSAITKTTDQAQQAHLYASKASLAGSLVGGDDKTSALAFALKAEELAPDYGTAILLAGLEEAAGDIKSAIKYYQLYLNRMTDAAKASDPGAYEFYTAHLKELESQANA